MFIRLLICFLLLVPVPASAELISSTVRDIVQSSAHDVFRGGWIIPADIPSAEASSLLAFYTATGGPSWTNSTGWGMSAMADDWYGVTVTAGHVTGLTMPTNNLVGNAGATLPTTLTSLDLGQNTGLTGITVSGLTACVAVDLAGCNFGQTVVSGILADLVTAAVNFGTLDIGGSNSAPEPTGVTSLITLEDRSWTLTYSIVAMENTGTFRVITEAGDATILSTALDLSGQTGKYIVVTDSAGKKAAAYGHAADDAEAFSTDLVAGWDFTSGWTLSGTGSIIDADSFASTSASAGGIFKSMLTVGRLVKISIAGATTSSQFSVLDANGAYLFSGITGTFDLSDSLCPTGAGLLIQHRYGIGVGQTDITTLTAYNYLAIGTTALQLRNAATGSTRNWALIESGFNWNTIAKVEVFNG